MLFRSKSRIIEWGQKEHRLVNYKMIEEKGSGHAKQYVVELTIEEESYGTGKDFSIKGAEKLISEKAWNKLIEKGLASEENIPDIHT